MSQVTQSVDSVAVKVAMALSGSGMAVWLALHATGNALSLGGAATMDTYGARLHASGVLWPVRALLVVALFVHVLGALVTTQRARAARPEPYRVQARRTQRGTSMRTTGTFIGAFLVLHVLSVYGVGHPSYSPGQFFASYRALVLAPAHAVLLAGASFVVARHLAHGVESALLSLGLLSGSRAALVTRLSNAYAWGVALAFVVPVARLWLSH